jgi:signal transduction histidine kinase
LANLLDNALAHGAGDIAVALSAAGALSVADAGPGIPEAERCAVQKRFYRLDRSRGTPGTGLGLALVAAIARLHGGALALQAGPGGRGLVVRIELPASSAAPPPS